MLHKPVFRKFVNQTFGFAFNYGLGYVAKNLALIGIHPFGAYIKTTIGKSNCAVGKKGQGGCVFISNIGGMAAKSVGG